MANTVKAGPVGQRDLFEVSLVPDRIKTERPAKSGLASVTYQRTRDILTRASGFMDAYDYTLNPYSGCSFGCTYCYAAFFATAAADRDRWGHWVRVKENAVQSLLRRKPGSLDGVRIYMSSVTDPYQPIERRLELTKNLLKVLKERHKPKLVVQTRSPDVVRDLGLFKDIEARGGRVQVNMTVTTDDEDVRRTFEPYCPSNRRRLDAIGRLVQGGVGACITMTPLIWVEDANQFARSLEETGVRKFIVQPFHFTKGKFVAGTRDAARGKMAAKLNCDVASFPRRYLQHYESVIHVLQHSLAREGSLGRGKDGFAPPF